MHQSTDKHKNPKKQNKNNKTNAKNSWRSARLSRLLIWQDFLKDQRSLRSSKVTSRWEGAGCVMEFKNRVCSRKTSLLEQQTGVRTRCLHQRNGEDAGVLQWQSQAFYNLGRPRKANTKTQKGETISTKQFLRIRGYWLLFPGFWKAVEYRHNNQPKTMINTTCE